jgi:hypothetical protein
MKYIRRFLHALPAPYYALMGNSEDYQPGRLDVGIWVYIAIILTLARWISDWAGWSWGKQEYLDYLAWFATLLCRLFLVEHEVDQLRQANNSANSHT